MARGLHKLTAKQVSSIKAAGRYSDGGGLYLRVTDTGLKRWVLRYKPPKSRKTREMGLGAAHQGGVSLREARELAKAARDELKQGRDPLKEKIEVDLTIRDVPAFGPFADEFVNGQATAFRNDKHIAQWRMTLTKYAAPIRKKAIDEIDTNDILGILEPLWQTKPETAHRLRGRIERVLNAAKVKGLRSGENPAAWRGHLEFLLPKRAKLTRGHFAAMPYMDVPAFIRDLKRREGLAARALEFLILGACRSGEVRHLQWSELDMNAKIWTVPKERMKAGRPHRVPLTDRMIAILREIEQMKLNEQYVFVGPNKHRPFSDAALGVVLKRMKIENCTVHGFRSSFRDWVGDNTNFPREVAEAALAHMVGDATERAYRRGDAFSKRRNLMEVWGEFCRSGQQS